MCDLDLGDALMMRSGCDGQVWRNCSKTGGGYGSRGKLRGKQEVQEVGLGRSQSQAAMGRASAGTRGLMRCRCCVLHFARGAVRCGAVRSPRCYLPDGKARYDEDVPCLHYTTPMLGLWCQLLSSGQSGKYAARSSGEEEKEEEGGSAVVGGVV